MIYFKLMYIDLIYMSYSVNWLGPSVELFLEIWQNCHSLFNVLLP